MRARALTFAIVCSGGCYLSGNPSDAGSDVSACTKTLPTDCTTIPSYANDIAPLVAERCLPCHAAGGVASDRDLTTYANVEQLESTVLSQVYGCLMPPRTPEPTR